MAFSHSFEYFRPGTLAEALSLLDQYKGDARLLAGGTDLAVHIKENMATPPVVIDVKRVTDFPGSRVSPKALYLNASTTFSDIVNHADLRKAYPMLWEAARSVASVGIRNRATLAGNICSAVPSLDVAPALLCYDAIVHVASSSGTREISIHDWFISPRKTACLGTEIMLGISITAPAVKHSGIYLKQGRYRGEDLAQAGLGVLITSDLQYRLAYCAVGPIPFRARAIEAVLNGKVLTAELISSAKAMVQDTVHPITDIRSSKEYRLHICEVMLERGLKAVEQRLNGAEFDSAEILGG
ncbi:MAG: hypothetical protein CVU48_01785 [Candidatus Cloacimonetes bacterium HGW-Cloacimonetes-1]|jgi:carbon-monoxide dehydrogenase medium subunit|nr:MAG: hypothetical protein CVU48_01785 [Candidatus Cloacimonetes bacterium HGW-Cloacimonetes-1]